MRSLEDLKKRFETRIKNQIDDHKGVLRFPVDYADMVKRLTAFGAACRLFNEGMVSGRPLHPGFLRAIEAKRPDLTVEWIVYMELRWKPLFTEAHNAYLNRLGREMKWGEW